MSNTPPPGIPPQGIPSPKYLTTGSITLRILRALASLKLTLVLILLLLVGVLIIYYTRIRFVWALAIPFIGFAINLAATVLTNPVFRRQMALLIFHLALIAIALLIAMDWLTYLKGRIEIVEGETFTGQTLSEESGPLHHRRLNNLRFTNESFTVNYTNTDGRLRRTDTRNQVAWVAPDGRSGRSVIGDQEPLLLSGYRFYTTTNKGFAPIFSWRPTDSSGEKIGAVLLPSFPRDYLQQKNEWKPPGSSTSVWILLQMDEEIFSRDRPSELRVPDKHKVVVRLNDKRWELKPGDSVPLPDGMLTYRELRKWMGYDVSYNFTLPWLLAASVLAVLSMAWHFWRKFAARPWNPGPVNPNPVFSNSDSFNQEHMPQVAENTKSNGIGKKADTGK